MGTMNEKPKLTMKDIAKRMSVSLPKKSGILIPFNCLPLLFVGFEIKSTLYKFIENNIIFLE